MGSDRGTPIRLVAHCCQGASFGFGLVLTVLTLAVMFWVAWCYFGLTIIQISDTQRRALVNYSYTTPKPSPSPTSSPVRSTTAAAEETSINSISKLPTTASVLRGTSRGESPAKVDKKQDVPLVASSLAKGDFASRDRPTHSVPAVGSQGSSISAISTPRGPPRPKDEPLADPGQRAAILSGSSSEESEEDGIHARRVMPPGIENRPEGKFETDHKSIRRTPSQSEPDSRRDISPTKVHDIEATSGNSRRPVDPEVDRKTSDDGKTHPQDYIDRDKVLPSRRDDIPRSDSETVYREPDFDRERPRRYESDADRERGRSRYDDLDDDRGSRSRYDQRDRGRDSDDRYSKGDTRVYPEDRPVRDDKYKEKVRERYPEDSRRRGDDDRYDDRYRDYVERPRYQDRDIDRRDGDRVLEERIPLKDDRYRDDDRYRPRSDDRYGPRDEDRYKPRDEARYRSDDDNRNRSRSEDKYSDKDDDRYKTRDADRYKDDDRYVARDDDRYRRDPIDRRDSTSRHRDEDRYRSRTDEGRYADVSPSRSRDDGFRKSTSRSSSDYPDEDRKYVDERDRYSPRTVEDRYVDVSPSRSGDRDFRPSSSRSTSDLPARDRKLSSSRSGYDDRNTETVSDDLGERDRSKSYGREDRNPTRISRPSYEEERYKENERVPSRYVEHEKRISPTRTIVEDSNSRSPLIELRPKVQIDDARYTEGEKDSRGKDDRYYDQEDRIRSTRVQDSRGSISRESPRRLTDDRDEYRTRLPNERTENDKIIDRREEVMLDRRSYASEEDEDYRRKDSRRDYEYEERSRRPTEETRPRYRDDEGYTERDRTDDDEYKRGKTRANYDGDSTRSRDRYVDETRRYEDRLSRDDGRYTSARDDRSPPLPPRKYDAYPEEEVRRRDPEPSTMRKELSMDRDERPRSSIPSRSEDRYYSREEYSESKPPSRRRYDDDLSLPDSRDYPDDRRRSGTTRIAEEPRIGSSMTSVYSREPSDVVVREKRFQNTENRPHSSRVYASDDTSREKSNLDSGSDSRSRDIVRPLSAKDVIEAAMRHSDTSNQNERKVNYPVFDPRVSNLTSPEIIRPSERRGTTITAKKRRST